MAGLSLLRDHIDEIGPNAYSTEKVRDYNGNASAKP